MIVQQKRTILIIYGPTGVGKSDLASHIAQQIPAEIVNADMGQLYSPLSIGTAKPDWKSEKTPHHLFDLIGQPIDCTVIQYRCMLMPLLEDIWARGNVPIVVGGSGFYVQSIFYPPMAGPVEQIDAGQWDDLYAIDPVRAMALHPHDTYRIRRALAIWYATGIKPSEYNIRFDPVASARIIYVTRERSDLHTRITQRTDTMMEQGWVNECRSFIGTPWEQFLRRKKLIGYPEIFDYLQGTLDWESTLECIARKTKAYAKRQQTFWGMFKRKLLIESKHACPDIQELNLTLTDPYLYINQLSQCLKDNEIRKSRC